MSFLRMNLMVRDDAVQFLAHVADGEKEDERGDERHHRKHYGGEVVDMVAESQNGGGLRAFQRPDMCPVEMGGPAVLHLFRSEMDEDDSESCSLSWFLASASSALASSRDCLLVFSSPT